jgi:hypothetical protein
LVFGNRYQSVDTARLASLCAAQFQYGPRFGIFAEIMVEADDAVYFRAGQVQRLCDVAHGIFANMAERFLHVMQDGQQWPFPVRMFGDYVSD